MSRRGLGAVLVAVLCSGCAGFSALERGEWRRVSSAKAADSRGPHEIITRERYEEEQRTDAVPSPLVAPVLNDSQALTLAVGEVLELTVTEEEGLIELFAQGSAVSWFWGPQVKRDEWVEGQDVVHHQSTLFVVGRSVGKSTLRLLVGGENGRSRDLPVTVH